VHSDIAEITGENPKWGPPVSLHLKRALPESRFRIEPVRFPSGTLSLAGDVLLPVGNPPFPAVVVIEGSTTEGRKLWTYRSIGDLFARHGIAALIYDKRGTGQSDGDIDRAGFGDLCEDAVAALRYLRNRGDIDSTTVGLFGISQGGWLAPKTALLLEGVSFVILLGGPAVSIWEQELHRVEYSMRAGIYGEDEPDVFSADEIEAAMAHTRLGFDVAQNPSHWDQWQASTEHAREASWSDYVALDSTIDELQGWLRYRFDPRETLRHLQQPILALFGSNDVFVPPVENVELMETLLAEAGNDAAKIVIFPGVGHDFFTGATLIGGAWEWPTGFWRWNRRAPGLADTIITWTLTHIRR
jgi:pimeloyl-ACP methyl ester carboxylesterase